MVSFSKNLISLFSDMRFDIVFWIPVVIGQNLYIGQPLNDKSYKFHHVTCDPSVPFDCMFLARGMSLEIWTHVI